MKVDDMGFPCQVCNLRDECNAKSDTNLCGMAKALEKSLFVSQQIHYFVIKNPIRRWLYSRYKKSAKIDVVLYEKVTGMKWAFVKDPFPEWNLKRKVK